MGKEWVSKLPNALWAYRTAYKTHIGMTPYQLVYGKTCHFSVELEFKSHWTVKEVEHGSPVGRRKKANVTGRAGGMKGEGIP